MNIGRYDVIVVGARCGRSGRLREVLAMGRRGAAVTRELSSRRALVQQAAAQRALEIAGSAAV